MELTVGQSLWWVDTENRKEGTVVIKELSDKEMTVEYNGKFHTRPITIVGEKLFFNSQLRKPDGNSNNKDTKISCIKKNSQDYKLQCIECGDEFIFSAKEIEFFKNNNLNRPKRCANCRKRNKENIDVKNGLKTNTFYCNPLNMTPVFGEGHIVTGWESEEQKEKWFANKFH